MKNKNILITLGVTTLLVGTSVAALAATGDSNELEVDPESQHLVETWEVKWTAKAETNGYHNVTGKFVTMKLGVGNGKLVNAQIAADDQSSTPQCSSSCVWGFVNLWDRHEGAAQYEYVGRTHAPTLAEGGQATWKFVAKVPAHHGEVRLEGHAYSLYFVNSGWGYWYMTTWSADFTQSTYKAVESDGKFWT